MVTIPDRVSARAAQRFTVDSGGCRVSTYSIASHGYAQIGWYGAGKTHMTLAHRAAWEHHHGPIPDDMTVDHVCKNRACVNLDHLRLLSNYENARRTSGRDWPLGTCIRGHSNDLLELDHRGRQRCSICNREDQVKYRQMKKERAAA